MAENNGEGRWLTAEEAVEAGLADRIIDPATVALQSTSESALPADKASTAETLNSAASEIIRFLLGRLAYRIEEWLENLYEKHLTKREERKTKKQIEKSSTTEEEPSQEDDLPQAAAQSPTRSVIAFDERQRSIEATPTKPVEDPSMNQPMQHANERAYADDARAFGRY